MKFGNSGCKLREEIIMEPIKRTIQKDSLDFMPNLEFSNSKGQSAPSSIIGLSDQIQNITPPLASKHHQLVEFEPADAKIIQTRRECQLTNFKFLYEFWPSANQIFCSGRVITGPKCDRVHNLFTWTIITGVSVCFFVIAAPYIWQEIHWLYVMLITYLYISTNIFLIFTQFSDPGIIPRKEILELQERFEELINKETKEDTSSCSDKRKKYQVQEKKICTTCQIVRPLRCSHCKDCGNCVEVFDHHCPFVNNCIGKRNYRYFIGFLMSVLLLGLGEIGGFMMLFFSNFGDGISQGRESIMIQNQTILVVVLFILGIPTIILTLLVLILALFHILLVYQGKTTKEKLAKQSILSKQKQPSTLWCNGSESMFDLRQKIPLSKIQEHRGKQL